MNITHIHPMLVHFPLVLWLLGTLILARVVVMGDDLTSRDFFPRLAVWTLILGSVLGLLAAAFGDIALDAALDAGFPEAPLEDHEETISAALWIFVLISSVLGFIHFRQPEAVPGWIRPALLLAAVIGLGVMLYGAWLGGQLVYDLGVNVSAVTSGK